MGDKPVPQGALHHRAGANDARPGLRQVIRVMLTPKERRHGIAVLAMMIFLALLETAGVASVLPFLAVLGNPDLVHSNPVLHWLYVSGRFRDTGSFLFALGVASFVLVATSSLFRIAAAYVSNRYVQMRRYSLSTRLLRTYLRQPYTFFLNRNSADLAKGVLSEVDVVMSQAVKPMLDLIAYGLVALVIIGLLVVADPRLAAVTTGVVGGLYAATYLLVRGWLRRMGKERVSVNLRRFQAASEAFGGIKDLKVLGREAAYIDRFRRPAHAYSKLQLMQATLSVIPKYIIEAVAFGGMLALALYLISTNNDLGHVLPMLGLYAFGGYRLLPAVQHVYGSVNSLRFGWPALEALYGDMQQVRQAEGVANTCDDEAGGQQGTLADDRLLLRSRFVLDGVSYAYPGAAGPALQDVDLVIPARSSVAFVGRTGAGKTTLADLVLGLLLPDSGKIEVDTRSLDKDSLPAWQANIGYVPQSIYLADASISENIAFGIPHQEIDQAAVERAAAIANIHDYIMHELPLGYGTTVGDRGVRLSGGQRQRIGIARALYHDPDVLIMDEATSALDSETEQAVMQAVARLAGKKTIIMIAHRLSTVRDCDQIVVLERGRIAGTGTYDQLKNANSAFQRLLAA